MDVVPRKVAVPLGIAAVVLCGAVAPIRWAQGNTAQAIFLGVLALISSGNLIGALRRQPAQPVAPAQASTSAPADRAPGSSTPEPAEDPRWHVETLADQLPDPADRRRVLRWFLAVAVACLAGVIACCVGAGVSGDLTFMAGAVMLAVPALVIFYGVGRNRVDL